MGNYLLIVITCINFFIGQMFLFKLDLRIFRNRTNVQTVTLLRNCSPTTVNNEIPMYDFF